MFFKNIDVFGERVAVNIHNKESIQTTFGGILTIIMIISAGVFSWIIGKDVIYREKPISYIQNIDYQNYAEMIMNNRELPFMVAVMDKDGRPINEEKYLYIEFLYKKYKIINASLELINQKSFELEKCTLESMPALTLEDFETYGLTNFMCPKNFNVTLSGYWSENHTNTLEILLRMCDKSKPNCADENETREFITKNDLNINLFYFHKRVNIQNFYFPIEKKSAYEYSYVHPDQYKFTRLMIMKNSLVTDSGFFFSSEEEMSFMQLVLFQNDVAKFDKERNILIQINIHSSKNYNLYHRQYIKIPEILASVEGLVKILSFVLTFMSLPFSKIKKFETIMNENFVVEKSNLSQHFNLNESNNLVRNFVNPNSIPTPSRISINNFTNNNELNNMMSNIGNRINSSINHSVQIEFSFFEKLKLICNKKRAKNAIIYKLGKKRIKQYFDFSYIIRIFEEFNQMKTIIFSDNQKKLFDYFSKPYLHDFNKEKLSSKEILAELKKFKENYATNSEFIDKNLLLFLDKF